MSDQKIIDLIRNNQHSKALTKLYRIYPAVLKYVTEYGGAESDAEDIFQDGLLVFMNKINEKHEQFYMSFPPHLNNEIEIYKQNLELALANQETSFSMKRLTNIRHYDPYTIFIPDISKIPANDTTADILYLPFNLMQDYIAEPQIEQKPLGKQVAVIGEETLGADFDKL